MRGRAQTSTFRSPMARDEVRREVVPVYMGLIKQIDDQMGVLFRFLDENRYFDNTLIVFTSDHGDYLGDHWMGEKDLFHEPSVKVPLIIYDPTAKATRGMVCDELVEAIDLAPTFLEVVGSNPALQSHRLEGRSLVPLLDGKTPHDWRSFVVSEYDYTLQPIGPVLGQAPRDSRLFMIADRRWKYIHAIGFRPMLFDMQSDPEEFRDLGNEPAYQDERDRLFGHLAQWGLRLSQRVTRSEQQMLDMFGRAEKRGVLIGVWDEHEVAPELWTHYLGGDSQ